MLSSRETKSNNAASSSSNSSTNFNFNNLKLPLVLASTLPSSKIEINGQCLLKNPNTSSTDSTLQVYFSNIK